MKETRILLWGLSSNNYVLRELFKRIVRQLNRKPNWRIVIKKETDRVATLDDVDGVLGMFNGDDHHLFKTLRARKIPTIDLSSMQSSGFPSVCVDNVAIGAVAARHLMDMGYTNFGYATLAHSSAQGIVTDRLHGFSRELESCGHRVIEIKGAETQREPWFSNYTYYPHAFDDVTKDLPKLMGIFTPGDRVSVSILDACQRAGVICPGHVGILGVNDDDVYCSTTNPTLSSINMDIEAWAAQAVDVLYQMVGDQMPPSNVGIPPKCVTERESTALMDDQNPELARVIRYVHQNVGFPIYVSDLVDLVSMSRRSLERQFKDAVGTSIKAYIIAYRIEKAKETLKTTTLPVQAVAMKFGFSSSNRFHNTFKAHVGMTPSQYRAQNKEGG